MNFSPRRLMALPSSPVISRCGPILTEFQGVTWDPMAKLSWCTATGPANFAPSGRTDRPSFGVELLRLELRNNVLVADLLLIAEMLLMKAKTGLFESYISARTTVRRRGSPRCQPSPVPNGVDSELRVAEPRGVRCVLSDSQVGLNGRSATGVFDDLHRARRQSRSCLQ